MAAIRTVLCPVDFSTATPHQLALATDVCRAFGARLVLHHNVESVPTGVGVGWMWKGEHQGPPSEADCEEALRRLLAELPEGVVAEARITRGLASPSVCVVGELVEADLVVVATHGELPEQHTSVTEQVLEHSRCSVLALHDAGVDRGVPRFGPAGDAPQVVLAPTDFSGESAKAVGFALELARRLPIELHLLHVTPPGEVAREPVEEVERRLRTLVPAELEARVRLDAVVGEPSAEIAKAAERLGASCIVMGEHTRAPLKRWFTRDTSREVLRQAHCPVWFVPDRAA
jgi:nucleotide-binding universal stress UspA family protein